jgi:hypothetical protein
MFTKLMDLQYRIVYKPGGTNAAADALSRRPHFDQLMAIFVCSPKWINEVELRMNSPNMLSLNLQLTLLLFPHML